MKFSSIGTAILLGIATLHLSAQTVYLNTRDITAPDQIDASIFINRGTFTANRPLLPYDFQNTLVFTNSGSMAGSLGGGFFGGGGGFFTSSFAGYRFDFTDDLGVRRPTRIFFNSPAGKIDLGNQVGDLSRFESVPTLDISATNLINHGEFSASAIGVIRLKGDQVDLREGLINIRPLLSGAASTSPDGFFPDVALDDVAWGIGDVTFPPSHLVTIDTNTAPFTMPFIAGAATPRYFETNASGRAIQDFISIKPSLTAPAPAHFFITVASETNQYIQAVVLRTPDLSIQSKVTFHGVSPDDPLALVLVDLFTTERNEITGIIDERHLYIADDLGKNPAPILLTNFSTLTTFRPSNFDVRRSRPFADKGFPSNAPSVSQDLFTKYFNKTYTNGLNYANLDTTNLYSAYQVLLSDPTDSSDPSSSTDRSLGAQRFSGRVEIDANILDMTHTRIRAEGAVSIKANNIVNLDSAFIDTPRLYYDIGTTNEVLDLKALSKKQVSRLKGDVRMFSTRWTNYVEVTVTNTLVDPPAAEIQRFETSFHVLIVDANLSGRQAVDVTSLITRANHVTIPDSISISESLLMDAADLTIGGNFFAPDFSSLVNFPNLTMLTNKGTIDIGSRDVNLGNQGTPNMEVIENSGRIFASGQFYKADYFVNRGFMTNSGQQEIGIETKNLILEKGNMGTLGEMRLTTDNFTTLDNTLSSGSYLWLDIRSNITDTVARRGSTITAGRGITLVQKPQTGDFSYSSLQLLLPALYRTATFNWAGSDVGVNVAGFTNNAAVGVLVLQGGTGARFDIAGTSGPGAIYVDMLDIGTNILKQLSSFLNIAPDFTIYFAAATNVLAEDLDGALDGRLRWVSSFLGPYSTVEVALADGQTLQVNKGVLESQKLDSDGDGIPNGADPSPFDPPTVRIDSVSVVDKPPLTAVVAWTAAPASSYVLESVDSLISTNWVPVKSINNPATAPAPLFVEDGVPDSSVQKYYRLRLVLPN